MSAGHIQRRGKSSWRLKFEGERDPEIGRRKTQYVTFRGTKAKAKLKLAELVAAVGDHVLARIDQWAASEAISAGPRSATESARMARSCRTSGADWCRS
jgi:hypothetical protein